MSQASGVQPENVALKNNVLKYNKIHSFSINTTTFYHEVGQLEKHNSMFEFGNIEDARCQHAGQLFQHSDAIFTLPNYFLRRSTSSISGIYDGYCESKLDFRTSIYDQYLMSKSSLCCISFEIVDQYIYNSPKCSSKSTLNICDSSSRPTDVSNESLAETYLITTKIDPAIISDDENEIPIQNMDSKIEESSMTKSPILSTTSIFVSNNSTDRNESLKVDTVPSITSLQNTENPIQSHLNDLEIKLSPLLPLSNPEPWRPKSFMIADHEYASTSEYSSCRNSDINTTSVVFNLKEEDEWNSNITVPLNPDMAQIGIIWISDSQFELMKSKLSSKILKLMNFSIMNQAHVYSRA